MMLNEYDKWRMRQNPIISSRVQVGGRPMPSWFSASLIQQARNITPPPPPLPTEPPPADETEYEEIDHLHSYTNMNVKKSSGAKRSCSLCGNPNPVVRCEMCNNQIFCGSCNDMYHRHPKRHNHVRKLLESLENRPPLPPKSFLPETPMAMKMSHAKSHSQLNTQHMHPPISHLPQLPGMMPVPPPRRHKRFGMRSAAGSPTFTRKVLFGLDPMGSLKRFVGGMGQRPLPPPPKSAGPPLPPKTGDLGRPMTPTPMGARGSNTMTVDRRHSSPLSSSTLQRPTMQSGRNIPLTVLEMQNVRNQSVSVANLSDKHPSSHDSGYRDWEDEDDFFSRQRASSISTSQLSRYPAVSSSNASHFATLQRPNRNHSQNAPQRPPPPVPPRHFSSQLSFQTSQSVFDLDRISASQNFGMPWNHPGSGYPGYDFQQVQQQEGMMGYPGTLHRTPSNSSVGGGPAHGQPFFGWGPMGFGQPMSQKEMHMMAAARQGSEPPPYGNQESLSQPATPQGSFRRKSARNSVDHNPGFERVKPQNQQQPAHHRPPTPTFARNTNLNHSNTRKHLESEEDSYFSEDRKAFESDSFDESKIEKTEEPEGPWSCEHCTFVNPKSTKVCTICCKTPLEGFRNVLSGKNNHMRRRSGSRLKDSSGSKEEVPVVKSKLSFSRTAEKQHVINLSTEQVKKRPPTPQKQQQSMFHNESENDGNDEGESEMKLTRSNKSPGNRLKGHKPFVNSNEDVYGSIPLQTLTISPKIDIRRPGKVSTGVGSSPPKLDTGVGGTPPSSPQPEQKSNGRVKSGHNSNRNSKSYEPNDNGIMEDTVSSAITVGITANKSNIITPSKLKVLSATTSTVTSTSTSSQGIQTSASSSSGSSSNISSFSFQGRKDIEVDKKSSKGTSPPPQSISTQTYEDIPASKMRQKSSSKQSILSLQSEDSGPPKAVEMSEKALRYARRAQNQSKLKRSMSTHLTTSTTDPWVDSSESRHMYRSSSRHSLASDTRSLPLSGPPSRDPSPPPRGGRFYEDFQRFPPPSWDRFPSPGDYFASIEDLVTRKRRESRISQEFELTRLLKEAEEFSYTPEDVQVALRMCGERNPIKWLQENWSNMIETVQTLATKYGREKGQDGNEVGTISSAEAKEALRVHRGNVWAAVTECVEQRRKKFVELQSRGTFLREDVLTALTANHGNLDAAYVELSKAQLKPFLMRIWGPPSGLDNDSMPPSPSVKSLDLEPLVPSAPIMSLMEKMKPYTDSQSQVKSLFETSLLEQLTSRTVGASLGKEEEEDLDASDSEESSEDEEELESEEELEIEIEEPSEEEIETENLNPEPRLEKLVSDAERVTMEIEKAIQELKLSGESKSGLTVSSIINANVTAIQEKLEELLPIISNSSDAPELAISLEQPATEILPENRKASVDSVQIVKSDGEEESFADAISDGDATAEQQNIVTASTSPVSCDLEQKIETIGVEMDVEIDESEALVSEFIQNFEIEPPKLPKAKIDSNAVPSEGPQEHIVEINQFSRDENVHQSKQGESNEPKTNKDESPKRILSSSEIEQILSSLVTTNFNSMGQFATDIKEKIATEIQHQLAAATATTISANTTKSDQGEALIISDLEVAVESVKNEAAATESDGGDSDKAYEPITLPQAISDNVNKKMAKYERVAAKKRLKVVRRKSPENSGTKTSSSGSPSPSTSLSHLARAFDSQVDESTVTINEPQSSELDPSDKIYSDVIVIPAEDNENDPEEVEMEQAVEEEEGFSVYEEVEMGKSDSVSASDQEEDIVDDIEEEAEVLSGDDEGNSESEGGNDNFDDFNQIYEEVEMKHENDKVVKELISAVQHASAATLFPISETTEDSEVLVEGKESPIISENEVHIQRLVAEGRSTSYERAELAVQLIDMAFTEEDAIYAANECSSLYSALSFLQQECDLCAGKFSAKNMVSMLRCTHWCCRSCAQEYFRVQVKDKTIIDATCPFCKEPSTLTEDSELATEYFNHLDILLKNLLDVHYHEMFQRKLRDWTLAKTPNFKWCSKCSSGFITEPLQTRLVCPDCSAVTCAICLQPWEKNHDHRDSNIVLCDVEASKSIADYLNENCIECPRCHFKFALARGGCMHLTCTQCHNEFCSGCSAPFRMGTKCEAKFALCDKLGLHAHHPRNCLFYLRDKEPETLIKLLEEHSIPYLKENAKEAEAASDKKRRLCQVPVQREVESGLVDGYCEKTAPFGCAKVCLLHYVEYLGLLIWQNHLDPITILSNDDLETIIRRANKKLPGRIPFGLSDSDYRPKLLKVIADDVPL